MTNVNLDAEDTLPESPTAGVVDEVPDTTVTSAAVGFASSRGLVRSRNEDAWGVRHGRLFIVCDGMGGFEGGDIAAQSAVAGFLDLAAREQARGQWSRLLQGVNNHVRTALSEAGIERGGTTLCAMVVEPGSVTVINVGDSRCYHHRRGRLTQLTVDHTLEEELRTAGRIDELNELGGISRGLTSYLGIRPELLRVDVFTPKTSPGDRVLLATDGVSKMLQHVELETAVATGTPEQAARSIVAMADKAGGIDNATAGIIEL